MQSKPSSNLKKSPSPGANRQEQMRTYLIVGGIAAAVLIALGIFLLIKPNNTPISGEGCNQVQDPPDEGRSHLSSPVQTPVYNENPPTSGLHNPTWQTAGVYANQQDLTMLVHSLEHGYIVIYHRDLTPDEYLKLANLAKSTPYKIIVTPYAKSPSRIALTAWTHMQKCDKYNEQVILAFINAYRDQGPEPGAQ